MEVNIKAIQELLGHSNISITLRTYSHLLPSMQQEVVDTWDNAHGMRNEISSSRGKSRIRVQLVMVRNPVLHTLFNPRSLCVYSDVGSEADNLNLAQ